MDDAAEQPEMCVLVAVYVAYLLRGAGHLAVAGEVVEEHEARVEVYALEDVVGHHDLEQGKGVLFHLELVVQVAYEGVAAQKVLVRFPLVEEMCIRDRDCSGLDYRLYGRLLPAYHAGPALYSRDFRGADSCCHAF